MTVTQEYAATVVDSEKWMTRADVATFLRVTTQTVDRHAREGRLPRYKIAGSRTPRFRIEDVRALLAPESQER